MICELSLHFDKLLNPTEPVFQEFCDSLLDAKLVIPVSYGDPHAGEYTFHTESDIEFTSDNTTNLISSVHLYCSAPQKDNHSALLNKIRPTESPFLNNIVKFRSGKTVLTGRLTRIEDGYGTSRDAFLANLNKIIPYGSDCSELYIKGVHLSRQDECSGGGEHEYVNTSFMQIKMACRKCNIDKA